MCRQWALERKCSGDQSNQATTNVKGRFHTFARQVPFQLAARRAACPLPGMKLKRTETKIPRSNPYSATLFFGFSLLISLGFL